MCASGPAPGLEILAWHAEKADDVEGARLADNRCSAALTLDQYVHALPAQPCMTHPDS